jgi:GT2 family glycosyltransferase
MRVGAVVVVWGDRPETEAALRSLVSMERKPDVVVCVAQECSPPFLARLRALAIPSLSLLEVTGNIGFAAAANMGIAHLLERGVEWVMLLNNDATADPPCLARCLEQAEKQHDVAVVGPAVRIMDRPAQLWFAGGVHSNAFAFTRHRGLRGPAESPPPTSDVDYISGCCAVISVAAWRQIGSFREEYFMYYEDVEWCERARRAGWRCVYVGETLCSHALGVSSGQRGSLGLSANTAYYLARNPLRFALETPTTLLRSTRVLGIVVIWGTYNVGRLRASADWSTVRAYWQGSIDALRGRMGRRPARPL